MTFPTSNVIVYYYAMRSSKGARWTVLPFVFALLAVMLAGVTPRGWMPSNSQGQLLLTLCSGTGTTIVAVKIGQPSSDDPGLEAQTCPFAVAATPAALPAAPAHDVPISWQAMDWHGMARLEAAPSRRNRVRPPLRGPPLLA